VELEPCPTRRSSDLTVGTADVTITLEGTPTAATCIAENGSLTVTATGGTEPYTYLWSNGETTQTITDLAAGDYSVVVTDANGCEAEATYTVGTADVTITLEGTPTAAMCIAENGSLTVTATGGTEPYTYLWSNGETTQTITDLAAGDYSVVVTDANGCEAEATYTVGTPSVPTRRSSDLTAATCIAENGSLT